VAIHTLEKLRPKVGDDYVVLGAGPMGQLQVQMAKLANCRVAAVDTIPERLTLAKKFGADYVFNPTEMNLADEINRAGIKPTYIVEAAGAQATHDQSVEIAAKGAKIALVGSGIHTIPIVQIVRKELEVYGVNGGPHAIPLGLKLVSDGYIDLKSLITHRYRLEDVKNAFDYFLASKKDVMKIIIES